MNLTLVTETFPPEINGVSMTLGRWVEAFRARGHSIQVIRPKQEGEQSAHELVPSLSLPFYKEVRLGIASSGRVRRLLTSSKADLIHVATEGPLGWAALRATERLGLPIASSFHTNFDHYTGHYGLSLFERFMRDYLRRFHNRCGVTLAPSETTKSRLVKVGFQRVEIWSRGVDGKLFHPDKRDEGLRGALSLGPEDVLLLYVGRFAPEKNLDALLEAYSRIDGAVSGRKVRLALVGDGPLFSRIQETHENLVMPGVQRGEALARWYASADIFAFPSCSETFGNVILEAQASGLPVVGFDCQSVDERLTHGSDGFLVDPASDFAAPIVDLCNNEALRKDMGVEARKKAETQDWKSIFDRLEERYRKMMEESSDRIAMA